MSDFKSSKDTEAVTVITEGTTISGGIRSDTALDVKGIIEGDVECQGKLTITGQVDGNCSATEIYVNTPRLEGNLDSLGSVKIDADTIIIGSITGTSAVIAGAVKVILMWKVRLLLILLQLCREISQQNLYRLIAVQL